MLLQKACDSLILGIELYNRPNDRGRVSGVLILTNHAFEMLLKATIAHKGERLHEPGASETIGFDACVRRGTSDSKIRFLTEEQALTIRSLNGLRDAAQHYLLGISEGQLYIHIQSAVTLFGDLLKSVFDRQLVNELPNRVLPVSTTPPTDIGAIFDSDVEEILKLLAPGRRRRIEAEARLMSLTLVDSRIEGEQGQPSIGRLRRIGKDLNRKHWSEVFKGAASIEITTDRVGPTLSIRLTKKEGPPIQIVDPDALGALPVAVKRVNELDFYNLNAKQLATKVGQTTPKLIAVVEYLGMREDPDCYKEFKIGSSLHKRYSQRAIGVVKNTLRDTAIEKIWEVYMGRDRRPR